jgi:Family of unknown function (DUF6962)
VDEVAAGVTDLVLGAVLVWCALRLRAAGAHRYWTAMFATAGAGAFAGTLHHLVFHGSKRASDLSWVVVGVLVAIAISYLLAASAVELVAPRTARLFIGLRIGGLVAYLVVITTLGVGRTLPLVLSESVTMASIVTLWVYGLRIGHPRAGRILVAIAVSALSAVAMVLRHTGMDPRSLQHVAQIPGVLLLCQALVVPVRAWTGRPTVARRANI